MIARGAVERAVRLYLEGEATLQEAAGIAGVTVREMIDVLLKRGVRGNVTRDQERNAIRFALGGDSTKS